MKFRDAVSKTPEIYNSVDFGLKAIKKDRNRLSFEDSRKICGSINLDKALRSLYPSEPRWDYGIGIEKTKYDDRVIWIEIHPADSSQVQLMINKLNWLKSWLKDKSPALKRITDQIEPFIWVASGRVTFQRNTPQAKRLAKAQITFPKEHYFIRTNRIG